MKLSTYLLNYSFRNNLALWYGKKLHCSDNCGSIFLFCIYFTLFYTHCVSSHYFVVWYIHIQYFHDLVSVVSFYRLSVAGTNLRTEPKHIVFLSQLLLLFQFCHVCKTDNPELEAKQVGTEAVITTSFSNPKCPKRTNTWHSQPSMPNSQIRAGNFLLCMAVLLAGSSATKVFQVFKDMGFAVFHLTHSSNTNGYNVSAERTCTCIRYTGVTLKSVEANQTTTSTYTRGK